MKKDESPHSAEGYEQLSERPWENKTRKMQAKQSDATDRQSDIELGRIGVRKEVDVTRE